MIYKITGDGIDIFDIENFSASQIFDSGQIFRYQTSSMGYKIAIENSISYLISEKDSAIINTNNPEAFVSFFDLDRDYSIIISELSRHRSLKKAIELGSGIRILNQDPLEMLISFILSANNNIPRIKKAIDKLCELAGEKVSDMYLFPTIDSLVQREIGFFEGIGAGYRSVYLLKTIDAIKNGFNLDIKGMTTLEARKHLMNLAGVGRKVADCVLLFGYHKTDVFPTDVWVERAYDEFFGINRLSPKQKSDTLLSMFGEYSGYAQQYLFYYMRYRNKK